MKTRNRRYPRSSGMDGDKSGKSGAFLFSRRVPDFCDGRRSFPINENSKFVLRGRRRWISLITNPLNCWAPVPLSQINMVSLENLGQTSGGYPIYRQNLGWSAKSKIPDRLGFSRHMKTRLKAIVVFDVLVAVVSLDRHVPILFAHKLSPPRKPLCVYF